MTDDANAETVTVTRKFKNDRMSKDDLAAIRLLAKKVRATAFWYLKACGEYSHEEQAAFRAWDHLVDAVGLLERLHGWSTPDAEDEGDLDIVDDPKDDAEGGS